MSSHWVQGVVAGVVIALGGVILAALPPVRSLEQAFGLAWLYALRGEREPPAEVRLVSMDSQAASTLGVPASPERWPRRLHAELVDHLARADTKVIVFDLFFRSAREPDDDHLLASAFARAGNVLLASRIRRDTQAGAAGTHEMIVETHERPLALLADAALGVAPMLLPRDDVRVDRFWTFKSDGFETPSLPTVALHAYAGKANETWFGLLPETSRRASLEGTVSGDSVQRSPHHLERTVAQLRRTFAAQVGQARARRMDVRDASARAALLALHTDEDLHYLNFYGPPGHIPATRYDAALNAGRAGTLSGYAGKVVFIGFAEPAQTEQRDNYFTVYTRPDGVDLSGMEISATALANLIDGSTLRRPSLLALSVLALGMLALGAAARLLSMPAAIGAVVLAAIGYLWFAEHQFARSAVWWPIFVPLALQAPGALVLGLTLRYRDLKHEREQIRKLLGMQVPARAVDLLARELGPLTQGDHTIQGACLMSDIQNYTVLSERLQPTELRRLLNRYYAAVFPPVLRNHGVVVDAVGDSMFALWAAVRPDVDVRQRTCLAALELNAALARFNQETDHAPLQARIGLHFGEVAFGPVGTPEHVETRVIGDIVNAANRIQGLNKQIGTRVLASGELLRGVDAILARPVGRFKLVGKATPLALFEPLGPRAETSEAQRWLCDVCTQALSAFAGAEFARAHELWSAVLARFPEDGPARYYIALCERLSAAPVEAEWNGVVEITSK